MYLRTRAAPSDPVSIGLINKIYGLSGVGGRTAEDGTNVVDEALPASGGEGSSLVEGGTDEPSAAGGGAFAGGTREGVWLGGAIGVGGATIGGDDAGASFSSFNALI